MSCMGAQGALDPSMSSQPGGSVPDDVLGSDRHLVWPRWRIRAQDELALETARLETAVCLGDLIERDPLGDTGSDGASCQQAEEPLQIFPEPGGMSRPHHIDRVAAGTLTDTQPPP